MCLTLTELEICFVRLLPKVRKWVTALMHTCTGIKLRKEFVRHRPTCAHTLRTQLEGTQTLLELMGKKYSESIVRELTERSEIILGVEEG